MLSKGTIAKVQHYIPQFLLRNFGNGKKDQLCVFDKKTGQTFSTNAKNVASESGFYNFETEGQCFTLETSLSEMEGKAKPLLKRVLDANNLSVLSPEDRANLSIFFSIQLTRTRCFREQWKQLPKLLEENLLKTAKNKDELKEFEHYTRIPDENQTAMETTSFMRKAPQNFALSFANKTWVLLQTDRKTPFHIGDNPITLQNSIDINGGLSGNIGLNVPGIEIYFPLSPTHALALWCPSHEKALRAAIDQNAVADPTGIKEILSAVYSGQPLIYNSENVLKFNSAQVYYSERYIFSCSDDFSLAYEMIRSHPKLRGGPRFNQNQE